MDVELRLMALESPTEYPNTMSGYGQYSGGDQSGDRGNDGGDRRRSQSPESNPAASSSRSSRFEPSLQPKVPQMIGPNMELGPPPKAPPRQFDDQGLEGILPANPPPPPKGAATLPGGNKHILPFASEWCDKKIEVTTNHHVIMSLPNPKLGRFIYQYHLTVKIPDDSQHMGTDQATAQQKARVHMRTDIIMFLKPDWVFDGVSMGFSPDLIVPVGQARQNTIKFPPARDGKANNILLKVENKGPLDIMPLIKALKNVPYAMFPYHPAGVNGLEDPIKWIQACFRKKPEQNMATKPNSNAYYGNLKGSTMSLRSTMGILEARRGVYQTFRMIFGKLTMNIDTATTAFWTPNKCLLDAATALMNVRSANEMIEAYRRNPGAWATNCGRLRGVMFHIVHLPPNTKGGQSDMRIKMKGFGKSANDTKFEATMPNGEKKMISVKDYFEKRYNIKLRYPQLPLVHSTKGDFPLEVCWTCESERFKEVLQGQETADFIQFATSRAGVRKQHIETNMKFLAHHHDRTLLNHGLTLDPQQLKLTGKMLHCPKLIYGQRKNLSPREGAWNNRGMHFIKPVTIKSWVMCHFKDERKNKDPDFPRFFDEMRTVWRGHGMGMPAEPPVVVTANFMGKYSDIIAQCRHEGKAKFGRDPDVIFFLFPRQSTPQYQIVKMGMDVDAGIVSQVMVQDKAFGPRGSAQYLGNIAMKVNVKMGGTNWIMEEAFFQTGRCMLIGGDVSHATPGQLRSPIPPPSTAAVVGTWDRECTAYTAVATAQPSTEQLILHCEQMFLELLGRYKQKNDGLLPQHIFYFRDGLSESEFDDIKQKEGKVLLDLTRSMGAQSQITVIVAVKRHHTRFFPVNKEDTTQNGNVKCGFVMEASAHFNDAFIVAHADLQGTKRPTRYITLVDQNKMPPMAFQRMIHSLCSTYARATRSVAVVPPIYYADQACERARLHLRAVGSDAASLGPVHPNLAWNMWWQ